MSFEKIEKVLESSMLWGALVRMHSWQSEHMLPLRHETSVHMQFNNLRRKLLEVDPFL